MSVGIDYSLGMANQDAKGFHYGVIAQNSLGQAWFDESQPDYGKPACPECGTEINDESGTFHCEEHGDISEDDVWPENPYTYYVDDAEYFATWSESLNCVILERSPYYTLARYCSPCVPGAGDLDSPDDDGVKTYAFGHDWFEDGKAPYPLYSVTTGEEVTA